MTPSSDTNSVTMILPMGVDSPAYRFEWQIELGFKSERTGTVKKNRCWERKNRVVSKQAEEIEK